MAATRSEHPTRLRDRASASNGGPASGVHADWRDARYQAFALLRIAFTAARYGAHLVAAWLAGIVMSLLTASDFYDIALRDFGLMLAALTLARLASIYDPPLRLARR